ncbi:dienelactone hydrolase family protein [Luteibaculum oceani]|uniref:Dienelactone hydrolase family protein n=1 Tax=Luteibaculum oceani TaxID=1294296 RepID=A0A5C6V8T0_9FLAO|nr:dienelactone hydrolase family protein [Luteibaculum oceani]TXC81489.1 dienelactone hydrolase family protein [Luteibaculum oceani]
MKTLFSLFSIIVFSITALGQNKLCCKASANNQFAALSGDQEFVASHTFNEELPVVKSGTNIKMKVPGEAPANGYLIPANELTNKYIFVFQEWWGLNDHIKAQSEKYWAKMKGQVNVIAVDLYDGETATTADLAGELMKSREEKRLRAIVDAAFLYAGKDAEVATVGWCFGGGWSLQAAIRGKEKVKACVMYYGMPETDPSKLAKINAPVLGLFAEHDGWITKELVDKFEDRMRGLEKDITIVWYDAVHAFANPSNNEYNPMLAADAFVRSSYFIRKNLLD